MVYELIPTEVLVHPQQIPETTRGPCPFSLLMHLSIKN